MNNVSLIGRISNDFELKTTQSGAAYCKYTLAVKRQVKKSEGVQDTDFIDCIAWRKSAETLCKYFKKGNLVGISGKVISSSYEKDGQKIKRQEILTNEIYFLEKKTQEPVKAPSAPGTEETAEDDLGLLPFEIN